VEHSIWWDADRNLSRWDKNGSIDASGDSYLSLINNYTAPLEYVNFVSPSHKCHIYGNDAAYPWRYGPVTGMEHRGQTVSGGVDFWRGRGYRPDLCASGTAMPKPCVAQAQLCIACLVLGGLVASLHCFAHSYLSPGRYRWQTKSLGGGLCYPLGWERGEASVQLLDFESSPRFHEDTFVPKKECLQAPTFKGCRAEAAKLAWLKLHGLQL